MEPRRCHNSMTNRTVKVLDDIQSGEIGNARRFEIAGLEEGGVTARCSRPQACRGGTTGPAMSHSAFVGGCAPGCQGGVRVPRPVRQPGPDVRESPGLERGCSAMLTKRGWRATSGVSDGRPAFPYRTIGPWPLRKRDGTSLYQRCPCHLPMYIGLFAYPGMTTILPRRRSGHHPPAR